MFVINKNQAKAKADTLHKFLAEKGITVPKSEMLNAVARMAGLEDWNALSAQFTPEAVDAQLRDIERDHAYDSLEAQDEGFGPECVVQVASGRWLVSPAYRGDDDEGVDYLRVCDQLGREIVYWSVDEFTDDASLVLGALVGALNDGRTDRMPNPHNPVADKITFADRKPKPKKRRGLAELDWGKVVQVQFKTADKVGEPLFGRRAYLSHDSLVFECLDAEREGVATAEALAHLDATADKVVLELGAWGEGFGLRTRQLRGLEMGPDGSWKLKDGRFLSFLSLTAME